MRAAWRFHGRHRSHTLAACRSGFRKLDDALAAVPGPVAVDFQLGWIAADPVGVDQNVRVRSSPLRGFCEVVPILLRQQRGRDVHLLELGSGREVGTDIVLEIIRLGSVSKWFACWA